MTGQDYSASITANITVQEAAERIKRVADWWTASFTGASGKLGDAFTARLGETFVEFAVVELVPEKRIVWRVTDCNLHFIKDKKEWKDTRVVFDISSDSAATTVTMTHAGLVPEAECFENCRTGWNFYFTESLRKLLTENQGIPDGRRSQESAEQGRSNHAKGNFWKPFFGHSSATRSGQHSEVLLRCPRRQNHESSGRKGLPSFGRQLLYRVYVWGCP